MSREESEKRHLAVADFIEIRPVPGRDWFCSSFDRGFGEKFFVSGKVRALFLHLNCNPTFSSHSKASFK